VRFAHLLGPAVDDCPFDLDRGSAVPADEVGGPGGGLAPSVERLVLLGDDDIGESGSVGVAA